MPATQRVFHIEHLLVGHLYTGHCAALRFGAVEEAMAARSCGQLPVVGATGGDCHRRLRAHRSTKVALRQPGSLARRAKIGAAETLISKASASIALKRR